MEDELTKVTSRPAFRPSARLVLAAVVAVAGACREDATPQKEVPASSQGASSAASASASAAAPAAPAATLPVLGLEELRPGPPSGAAWELHPIEGALMVSEGQRVGRLVTRSNEDAGSSPTIEWVGKIPKGSPALGDNILRSVRGRWPDAVGAEYTSSNGRALQPTYRLLTGRTASFTIAEGGGLGWLSGVAIVGESVVAAGWSMFEGTQLFTLRGPKLARHALTVSEACKPDEYTKPDYGPEPPAVSPYRFGATSAGTLLTIGTTCQKRGPHAEVWDKSSGKSRLVDLRPWWKDAGFSIEILTGPGDELWATQGAWDPILHYRDGTFEPLPPLDKPVRDVFVSPRGELHVSDGETIHRRDEGRWTPVATLEKPSAVSKLAMDGETFWAESGPNIAKLRETARAPLPGGCATPFVYLYEVADNNAKDFTFPSTRKALSAFPEASAVRLVEFQDGKRHLGVTVTSKAQGEALVAHVKATMKDERPRLHCYAPKAPRVIDLDPKEK